MYTYAHTLGKHLKFYIRVTVRIWRCLSPCLLWS